MLEIEKKYLVNELPDLSDYPFDEIEQGYLSFIPEIRIRRKGKNCYITKKGEGTQTREELETEINTTAYDILSSLVQGRVIRKTRYKIPLEDNLTAELDIYHDDLDGLLTVETEFKSEEQAQEFVSPDWFGKEVTEDKKYKNKNLARIEELSLLLSKSTQSETQKRLSIQANTPNQNK